MSNLQYIEALHWLQAHCHKVTTLFKDLRDNWPDKDLKMSLDAEGYLQTEGDMTDGEEDFNDARDGFGFYRKRMNSDLMNMRKEWPNEDIQLEVVETATVFHRIEPS